MGENTQKREEFFEGIGYRFEKTALFQQAVCHSSYHNEHREEIAGDNERLEFLGDAVLEMVSSDYLFRNFPDMPEGDMTKLRASLVCEPTLALDARRIGLPEHILLGKGEENTGGRLRDSIVSDAMEALIGAIYLDGGIESARDFILSFVLDDIEHKKLFYDSKTILQEIIQRDYKDEELIYELVKEEGPDHAKRFVMRVRIGEQILGSGEGSTKKAAQQDAAYQAILYLQDR